MAISPRPQVELEKTYNAAADHYDHPAVSFCHRYGRRTVDRLRLIPGIPFLMFVAAWARPPFQQPKPLVQLDMLSLSISPKSSSIKDPNGLRNKVSQTLSFVGQTSKVCLFVIERLTLYSVFLGSFSSRT
jgi:hypothetical protein